MLERYGHGGDLLTADEVYGRPNNNAWIDFSSNMNPFGPPGVVELIMRDHWQEISSYPDPAVRGLRGKLSRMYRISEESILVGNGAAELIDLAVRVLQPKTTAIARPSFSEYEEAVHKTGGNIHEILLTAKHDFALQEHEWREALLRSDVLFLGHPNNPTGRLAPPQLVQQALDNGATVILDEAFIDFIPQEERFSFVRQAASSERLFVIRSMTKFYTIPGIRLGFLVGHPSQIKRMRQLQVPWSVNYLAQLIGAAVLDERDYAQRTIAWLPEERSWLMDRLKALGLKIFPSDVNFLLFSIPRDSGWNVTLAQKFLAQRGILIRDASLFTGLDESYCRIAVRLRADNERLVAELKSMLAAEAPIES